MFLGNPSARVRDKLWSLAVEKAKKEGSVIQIWSDRSEQGYKFRTYGRNDRELVDVEGLALVRRRFHERRETA